MMQPRRAVLNKGMLHVETPLGIVNILVGLSDHKGRRVDAVQVIPNHYAGERKVVRRGYGNTRLVELLTVKGGR